MNWDIWIFIIIAAVLTYGAFTVGSLAGCMVLLMFVIMLGAFGG